MSATPSWLPKAFTVADVRLTRVFQHQPQRCASITEYSQATGIDVLTVIELLAPAIDGQILALESVAGETFVLTAPGGRPVPAGLPDPPANLWETLRSGRSITRAYDLYRLCRALQVAGWSVEARPANIAASLGPVNALPDLSVLSRGKLVPVVADATTSQVADPHGRLSELARAGAGNTALTIPAGALDDYVTVVRSWFNKADHRFMTVSLLEAPRYAPVDLTYSDAAVAPRAFRNVNWTDPE